MTTDTQPTGRGLRRLRLGAIILFAILFGIISATGFFGLSFFLPLLDGIFTPGSGGAAQVIVASFALPGVAFSLFFAIGGAIVALSLAYAGVHEVRDTRRRAP